MNQLKREKGAKQEEAEECGRNVPTARCDFEMAVLPVKVEKGRVKGPVIARESKAYWREDDVFGDGPS
jgi:hypothetical protein